MASLTLLPIQDVYVSEWYENQNFDFSIGLFVSQYKQPGDDYRSLFQFDLASLPPASSIEKAELELKIYRNEVSDSISVEAHRLLNNWTEDQIIWNNQPPFSPESDGTTFITSTTALEFISIDITNLARGWYDGSIPNNGLILIGNEAENDLVGFVSTRGCYSNEWPKLRIEFVEGVINCFPPQELQVPQEGCPLTESYAIPLGPRKKASFLVANRSASHHVRAIVQVGFSDDPDELFFDVGEWSCLGPSGLPGEAVALSTSAVAKFARVLIDGYGGEHVIVFSQTREI